MDEQLRIILIIIVSVSILLKIFNRIHNKLLIYHVTNVIVYKIALNPQNELHFKFAKTHLQHQSS